MDQDQDDTYDSGEELGGWAAVVEDTNGNTYQTTTDAQGSYVFQNLPATETYTAKFYCLEGGQYGGEFDVPNLESGDFEVGKDLPIDPS